ncbi:MULTISPECIES: hypothetical protein [Rhodopseudomonas]|uniref:hypothetical protein n=1 Tax=Rhodopseudomonas TaxID=1073 RepID=UPI001F2C749F|nr:MULTISPECIES: hypothetical protein [Rhodopseudomonas]WOK19719.1 hypothetical protein RBJ75_09455 [Rhodopseudomonas sp. BAL398]
MALQPDRQAKRRRLPIEKSVTKINRRTLQGQLAAILQVGHASDIMRSECRPRLDSEISGGHEFQLELLLDCAISSLARAQPPRRLALEFPLAGIADVGPDHESEQMLGIDILAMHHTRKQCYEPCYCQAEYS